MADPSPSYAFGCYRLIPARRALLAEGQEVALRGRAFDLLLALVERRDRVVTKEELLELVWPGRVVEEGNLTVHVAGLRKLLGQGVIATLSGRGYRFVAPVSETPGAPHATPGPAPGQTPSSPAALPVPLTRLLGRQEDLDRLAASFEAARLVTVLGPGGVGKTRLALAAADRLRERFPDGIWFADLGAQDDPALVPKAIAAALGLDVRGGGFLASTGLWLAKRHGLLLLDGCEHLLQATAEAAETILRASPGVAILATSREPLRAEGEALHRLEPLGLAEPETEVTARVLRDHAASALFLDRVRAARGEFDPGDSDAAEIMAICRRLDGLPLAIELAAPMLRALSPAQLRDRLDRHFGLTGGRRTAPPRQQTLQATIAWSFELLAPEELGLLRRLSVLVGSWTASAAAAVAGEEEETWRLIANLVDKSLLQADLSGVEPRYRMLDATRFQAGEMLAAGDAAAARGRLAQWLLRIGAEAEAAWPRMPDADWSERYGAERDNLRAALASAFGEGGDPALGAALVSLGGELLGELHATGELMAWFDRALAHVTAATPADVAGRLWLGRCGWLAAGEPGALSAAERAVALFRKAGGFDLGRALSHQALQHAALGELDAAEPLLAEAEALLRALPESKALVSLRRVQALVQARRGRPDRARPILDAAFAAAERLGARRDAALVSGDIAELLFAAGEVDAAIATAQGALSALGPVKSRSAWVQHIHGALASYLLAKGEMAEARRLAGDRLYAARIMGIPNEVLSNLERAGLIAALEGDAAAAGRLLGHSEARQAARAVPRSLTSETIVARLRETLGARLPVETLRRLAEEGARLSEDQAIAEAARAMP